MLYEPTVMDLYRKTQNMLATNLNSRQMERDILIRITRAIESARDSGDRQAIQNAVLDNQTIWITFVSEVVDERNQLPKELKRLILSVGMSVLNEINTNFRREMDLDFMIDINRNIIAGLGSE
jgi:flagellar protein FlaF